MGLRYIGFFLAATILGMGLRYIGFFLAATILVMGLRYIDFLLTVAFLIFGLLYTAFFFAITLLVFGLMYGWGLGYFRGGLRGAFFFATAFFDLFCWESRYSPAAIAPTIIIFLFTLV